MRKSRKIIIAALSLFLSVAAYADTDWDIKVFIPGVDKYDHTDLYVKASDLYKKETGGKVEFVSGPEDGGEVILLANKYAGTPLDMIYVRDRDFQRYINHEYIKETGWFVNQLRLVVDQNQILDIPASESLFSKDGNPYAVSQIYATNAYVVVYNKSLFIEEGISSSVSPKSLASKGKWTWERLENYARKLTKNPESKSEKPCVGLGTSCPEIFPYMNGSAYVAIDVYGHSRQNLLSDGVREAFSLLSRGVKQGWLTTNSELISTKFKNRECAMVICLDKDVPSLIADMGDSIEYVRLPYGPSTDRSQNITSTYGFAITSESKKETACGKFIEYILRETYARDRNDRSIWPSELVEVSNDIIASPDYFDRVDATLVPTIHNLVDDVVLNQLQPESAVYKYQLKAMDILPHTNERLIYEPTGFRGVVQNFNRITNDDGYFRPFPGSKTGNATLVSGKEAINGRSLKISFNRSVEGNGSYIVLTDSEKLGLVGWRNFQISYDVMVEGDLDLNSCVYSQIYVDGVTQFGRQVQYVTETGKIYHVTGEYSGVLKTGRVSMCFGIAGCDSAIIDNITVIEK